MHNIIIGSGDGDRTTYDIKAGKAAGDEYGKSAQESKESTRLFLGNEYRKSLGDEYGK